MSSSRVLRREKKIKVNQAGFSLLECVIAIVILTVGLLGVAALATVATRTEVFAYKTNEASSLATSKMEEIKAGTLTNGGSLISDATGYSDVPNFNYYRRWQISDGPSGTKKVTVVVIPQVSNTTVRATQVDTLIR